MNKEELYKQSLNDLLRITVIFVEILRDKELTDVEERRIDYATKVVEDASRKQIYINKLP